MADETTRHTKIAALYRCCEVDNEATANIEAAAVLVEFAKNKTIKEDDAYQGKEEDDGKEDKSGKRHVRGQTGAESGLGARESLAVAHRRQKGAAVPALRPDLDDRSRPPGRQRARDLESSTIAWIYDFTSAIVYQ